MSGLIKSFTLVELIIVVIIVGILASLGFTQYSGVVEKTRLGEAKVRIGVMRNLAYEYYLNNGSLDGITNADVGGDNVCTSSGYYKYFFWAGDSTRLLLVADRCTSGGKAPNAIREYVYFMNFYPGTGTIRWSCHYSDVTSCCYGLPVW